MPTITSLSQLDLNGTYTYADYLTWQFEQTVELIKGRLPKWLRQAEGISAFHVN